MVNNNNFDDLFNLSFSQTSFKNSGSSNSEKSEKEQKIHATASDAFPALTPSKKSTHNYSSIVKKNLPKEEATTATVLDYAKALKKETPLKNNAVSKSKELEHRSNPETLECNKQIVRHLNNHEINIALNLLEDMIKFGPKPDLYSFHPFLNYYAGQKDLEKFYSFLKKMEEFGLSREVKTYNVLLNFHASDHNLPELERIIFKEMPKRNVAPDIISYNCYFKYFASVRQGMPDVFKLLHHAHLKANERTFHILMDYHIRRGEIQEALDKFSMMEKMGIERNSATYSTILNYYVEKEDEVAATHLVADMEKQSIELDERVTNSLMTLYIYRNNPQQVEKYFELLIKNKFISVASFNTLLDFYYKTENYKGMDLLWKRLGKLPIKSDIQSYNLMLKKSLAQKDFKAFFTLQDDLKKRGIAKDAITRRIDLRKTAVLGTVDELFKQFRTIENPSTKDYDVMIGLLRNKESLSLAKNLLAEMDSPTDVTFTTFLDYYLKTKNIAEFQTTLKQMQKYGLTPERNLINQFIDVLVSESDPKMVNDPKYLKEAKEIVKDYFHFDPKQSLYDFHGMSHGAAYCTLLLTVPHLSKKTPTKFITGIGNHERLERLAMQNYIIEKIRNFHPTLTFSKHQTNEGVIFVKIK